ncbi:signal peptidase I [Fredinandcohnia onubensis]|uniref:signal peptidase I n=1 Tax=Fredinandcohnia onubensis TaxID=1571209 RepID=UPI000C0BF275|nr:signal peptidase I [Fredinandcohnia onubensis]
MLKKTLRWSGNVLFVLLVLLSVLALVSIFQSKNQVGQVPSILGFKIMTVMTGSMQPELQPGDMIIVKEKDPSKLQVEDVITYQLNEHTLVTHRIVDLVEKDGVVLYQTKGDANNVVDNGFVSQEQIVGVLALTIPKAGHLAQVLQTPTGIIIISLLILLIITLGMIKKMLTAQREESSHT